MAEKNVPHIRLATCRRLHLGGKLYVRGHTFPCPDKELYKTLMETGDFELVDPELEDEARAEAVPQPTDAGGRVTINRQRRKTGRRRRSRQSSEPPVRGENAEPAVPV